MTFIASVSNITPSKAPAAYSRKTLQPFLIAESSRKDTL